MLSGPYEIRAPSSSMRLSVLFREESTMTPSWPMMSAMAEDERLRIIKRTHEGRQVARARGVKMGRKPKLTPHQIKEARQRLAKGEPTRGLAKSYGVSVSTISRLVA